MSGSNRLINSKNTLANGSQQELTPKLENANVEAIKETAEKISINVERT